MIALLKCGFQPAARACMLPAKGGGIAQVICAAGSMVAIVLYMRSSHTNLRLRRHPLRAEHFASILGVGLLSTINALMTTLSISALTAAAGLAGVAAIAGYGIASRLDSLLIPIMFGFGTAAITVIGTSLGAGAVARARKAALVNALFVAAILEVLGLTVAFVPSIWTSHFSTDPQALAVAGSYLRAMGPLYGFVAIASELYFAGQGARRVGWPLAAATARFLCAVVAALLVFRGVASLDQAFTVVAFGSLAACAISLFGFWRVRWTART